ncbi:unnamed protein product [Protopolystoma xenopodis]|uniref:Uncharacterized protein n=1 Tax=Protopolystoma xenopodis TaxID=117903 RepID=A0A3S4ZU49_9PLAT|nr:unnamed protein product [Protopolystoma xenopodis]
MLWATTYIPPLFTQTPQGAVQTGCSLGCHLLNASINPRPGVCPNHSSYRGSSQRPILSTSPASSPPSSSFSLVSSSSSPPPPLFDSSLSHRLSLTASSDANFTLTTPIAHAKHETATSEAEPPDWWRRPVRRPSHQSPRQPRRAVSRTGVRSLLVASHSLVDRISDHEEESRARGRREDEGGDGGERSVPTGGGGSFMAFPTNCLTKCSLDSDCLEPLERSNKEMTIPMPDRLQNNRSVRYSCPQVYSNSLPLISSTRHMPLDCDSSRISPQFGSFLLTTELEKDTITPAI